MTIFCPKPLTLDEWLCHLESIHPSNIEMGLDRVSQVYRKLNLDFSRTRTIMVAGTNGKGTTCAMVEKALLLQGIRCGVYSSPHIHDYRERVRINGQMLAPELHCDAFSVIEEARGKIPLTYFEFGSLAGLYLMSRQNLNVAILEVGLGGRLDAINVHDADLAVITTIDLDHQDYLGHTREVIALEKAGIMRAGGQAIIGENNPPETLTAKVAELGVNAQWQGKDFVLTETDKGYLWQGNNQRLTLSRPGIPPQNMSTALAILEWLHLELSSEQQQALCSMTVAGRCQLVQQNPDILLDVAHNPQAARYLASAIAGRTYRCLRLVVGMLADKDIQATLAPLIDLAPVWYIGNLNGPRGADAQQVAGHLAGQEVSCFTDIQQACKLAIEDAHNDDLVVVFGSFYTVADIMANYPSSQGE